jgi:hypothetical protein
VEAATRALNDATDPRARPARLLASGFRLDNSAGASGPRGGRGGGAGGPGGQLHPHGRTSPSPTSPRSGSCAVPSSAASSTNTSEPRRRPGQVWWPCSGTPQGGAATGADTAWPAMSRVAAAAARVPEPAGRPAGSTRGPRRYRPAASAQGKAAAYPGGTRVRGTAGLATRHRGSPAGRTLVPAPARLGLIIQNYVRYFRTASAGPALPAAADPHPALPASCTPRPEAVRREQPVTDEQSSATVRSIT